MGTVDTEMEQFQQELMRSVQQMKAGQAARVTKVARTCGSAGGAVTAPILTMNTTHRRRIKPAAH